VVGDCGILAPSFLSGTLAMAEELCLVTHSPMMHHFTTEPENPSPKLPILEPNKSFKKLIFFFFFFLVFCYSHRKLAGTLVFYQAESCGMISSKTHLKLHPGWIYQGLSPHL
jgi:hypothetical protein